VNSLRKRYPGKKIEVWAEDEARIGLQPVIRRQWFKVGSRPKAPCQIQYKWIYVYGFVEPASGKTHWLLLPSVSLDLMQVALDSFAKEHVKKDRIIVLLWDQAGFHQSTRLTMPEGLKVFPLPAYTPELQPAERLWSTLRESIANRWVSSLDNLEDLLGKRIRNLIATPEVIQRLTGFHWILTAANDTN